MDKVILDQLKTGKDDHISITTYKELQARFNDFLSNQSGNDIETHLALETNFIDVEKMKEMMLSKMRITRVVKDRNGNSITEYDYLASIMKMIKALRNNNEK